MYSELRGVMKGKMLMCFLPDGGLGQEHKSSFSITSDTLGVRQCAKSSCSLEELKSW